MRLMYLVLLSSIPTGVFAGQSGYIKNGKTYIVYKDGEKVGEYPANLSVKETRKPASSTQGYGGEVLLRFEEDEFARCYIAARRPGYEVHEPLFCIPKK